MYHREFHEGIFKFENCVNYANEMTDHVMHSTQYYLKYINRAILANLQRRPLKLGRLIVLQETHLRLFKLYSHGNSLFSSPHPLDLSMLVNFQLEKRLNGLSTQSNVSICLLDHAYRIRGTICKYESRTLKVARNDFNIGEVYNLVCCHGN